jgi:hypothetical protein
MRVMQVVKPAQAEALNQVVRQLRAMVGGGSEQSSDTAAREHRRAAPVAPEHRRSLNALKRAVVAAEIAGAGGSAGSRRQAGSQLVSAGR